MLAVSGLKESGPTAGPDVMARGSVALTPARRAMENPRAIVMLPYAVMLPATQAGDNLNHVAFFQRAAFDTGQNLALNPCVK